jgi:hypothetical protein
MPNYTRNLRRFGFSDEDLSGDGSERLIWAVIASGAAAALDRVREHLDAGAGHVVVQPLDDSGGFDAGALEGLAVALALLMK